MCAIDSSVRLPFALRERLGATPVGLGRHPFKTCDSIEVTMNSSSLLSAAFAGIVLATLVSEPSFAKDPTSPTANAKEFTTGCVSIPLPSTPTGPTYSAVYQRNSETADFVVWRVPCGATRAEAQTLVRISPRTGSPFVCSFTILQAGIQFDSITFQRSTSLSDSICSDVLVPITAFIPTSTASGVRFDDDAAFTIIYTSSGSNSAGIRLEVPAYDPALYGVEPPAFEIKPGMSGAWNTAGVAAQGWYFDINQSGKVFAAAWFTGSQNGLSLDWYSALGTYAGDAVTATLFRSTGVGFAQGSTATTAPFGTLTFEFESCTSGVATWQMNDGRTGSLPIRKLLPPPAGSGC